MRITEVADRDVTVIRRAYELACLEAGLDPCERELNLRIRIISGILEGLNAGKCSAQALALCGITRLERSDTLLC